MKSALLFLLLASPAFAQKTTIAFSCDCEDSAGLVYATAMRDALFTSPRYSESTGLSAYQLNAVSLDPSLSREGVTTVLAIALVRANGTYVANIIQFCNAKSAAHCAAQTLSRIDQVLTLSIATRE